MKQPNETKTHAINMKGHKVRWRKNRAYRAEQASKAVRLALEKEPVNEVEI